MSMAPKSEWTLEEVDDAVRGGAPEAVAAIEWFWREGSLMERHSEFIRRAKEWRTRSEVQALFERLRPAPPMRQDKQFPGLVDWLALSSVLGRTDEILAWFDARVAANDLPVPQMSRLMSALLERGKWVDWLAFSEPLASVTDLLASVGGTCQRE